MSSTIGSKIKNKYEGIENRFKVCFFAALICGILAHIYVMTNHLYNYDELWHTPTGFGTGTEVGRWALSITVWIQKVLFDDVFTIPVINGMITIILYALTACFAVSVLGIKDEFYAGITGALMTTFPALTCRMFYMFTTHYYAIGLFMVACGVWVLVRKKHGILNMCVSVALLVYGMAIYQANFVTGVCLLVGYLLQKFIREDYELKDAIRSCANYAIYLAVCMVLFLLGSKAMLLITGKQMETYENLDTMGQLTPTQLMEGIAKCYKTFLKIPFKDVYAMNPNGIVRLAFLVGIIVILYTVLCVIFSDKLPHMKILIILIVLVLPIAVNLIAIMAISSGTMYSIMVYEMVFMFIIPVACLEALREGVRDVHNRGAEQGDSLHAEKNDLREKKDFIIKGFKPLNIVTAVMLSATVLTYIWFANGNYLAVEYTNIHDNAYYQVLMTQIKSVPGYRDDMPVATIGKPVNDSTNGRQDMIGATFNLGGKSSTNINAYSSWNIMTRVLGFDPAVRNSDEDETFFEGLDEVKNMPNYPDDGSIKVIDNTIVIKFQDIDEINADE